MHININNKNYILKTYKNVFYRFMGLMFKKKKLNHIICFPKCNAIHTFFMLQNIDICMTDENNKIVYLKQNVKPWRIIIYKDAYYTFELPLYLSKNLQIGQQLSIK